MIAALVDRLRRQSTHAPGGVQRQPDHEQQDGRSREARRWRVAGEDTHRRFRRRWLTCEIGFGSVFRWFTENFQLAAYSERRAKNSAYFGGTNGKCAMMVLIAPTAATPAPMSVAI
jgi:hypothetical protein